MVNYPAILSSVSNLSTTLNGWYDASDPSGNGNIPINGASIPTWKDKSIFNNDMTAGANATYTVNGQNNLGTMSFDGNSWYGTATRSSVTYPTEAYVVVKITDLTGPYDILAIGNSSGDDFISLTFAEANAGKWINGSSGLRKTVASTVSETSTNFLLMQLSIADYNFYIYRNGVQIMYNNSITWSTPSNPEYRIGARQYNGYSGNRLKGSIAEVLFFNTQKGTADRQSIEGYLAWKWGLQSLLPLNHPYGIAMGQLQAKSLYLSGYLNSFLVNSPSYNVPATSLTATTNNVSLYSTNMIASGSGFAINSDQRIKKNIQYLNSTDSFELVKNLKPAMFQYVDFMKGTIPKYGYLAQEVETVLPCAVNKHMGYIPNIFETVKIEKNKITLNEKTTETLGIGTKLQFYDIHDMVLYRQVVEVMDEKSFMVNEGFLGEFELDSIFLYGQEVTDYRLIDTDQMNTMLLSAIQETQTILEEQQKIIDDLRNSNSHESDIIQ